MTRTIDTRCVIAGGGPAGMMLGLLLARAGVDVVILEKHGDFLRDFRGDTVHPSTLQLIHELGALDEFLQRPHSKVDRLALIFEGERVPVGDFTHLKMAAPYVAFTPQWHFLDFLADLGRTYSGFHLLMNAEVKELVRTGGRVTGVRVDTPDGPLQVNALLTVGADGRHSDVRAQSGLEVRSFGAPVDVLWMRLPRRDADPDEVLGFIRAGSIFVMLNRGDYWQCAFVIPKGTHERLRERGLPAFREAVARAAPFVGERTSELRDWNEIKLLTVMVDRLERWHAPGILCIGDAAHAMSPVGGVGINLAVQDAVAAANRLWRPLRDGMVTDHDLAAVQRRRLFPTRVTQWAQVQIQERLLMAVMNATEPLTMPLPLLLARTFPVLRRIPARLVGVGVRPEHIESPELL